jgi:hypothetical protein
MSDTMSDSRENTEDKAEIALEVELDAPPEKVWRAIAVATFRERWLPEADLAEPDPIASIPGVEVRYRMREEGAPFPESTVTFRIEPRLKGGVLLRIIHRIESDAYLSGANDNLCPVNLGRDAIWPNQGRRCERSEAIQENVERPTIPESPRRFAPRDDGSTKMQFALAA